MSLETQNKIIAIVVLILLVFIVGASVLWLRASREEKESEVTPEQIEVILKELAKPVLGADGKPLPPPSATATEAILKELAKPVLGADGKPLPPPSATETAKILEQLSRPAN